MGYSFAAGTTDGPGAFDFTQGTTTDNPLWNAVRDFLAAPTQDDINCQHPKPILLSTGRVNKKKLNFFSLFSLICFSFNSGFIPVRMATENSSYTTFTNR